MINLKALNRFLPKEKFKMEGLHTAHCLLLKGDHMMKLDVKDAYYAVPIHQESRKYLRFQFKGTTYEFCCLPFGLSLATRVFTRILRPIVAKLRSEGIQTVIYLDNLHLTHHQKDTLSELFLYVRRLLSSLGFIVKLEKCSPEPTCCLVFLGAVLDTTYMSVALPEEQINWIQGACQEMLESRSTSLHGLLSLLGRMSHVAWTGLWIAPLYYRALQRQQALLFHRFGWRPRCQMPLSQPPWRTSDGGCPQLCMITTIRTSLLLHSTLPSGPMHPYWAGVEAAMARRQGDTGVWRRQNNRSVVWNSRQPF